MTGTSLWALAAAEPGRLAIVSDGGPSVTYGELAALANRVANGLTALGLRTGDRVALLMSNRIEFVAVQLATHQTGLVLAPLNRHLTAAESSYLLQDADAAVLITDAAVGATARQAADEAGLPVAARFAVDPVDGFKPFARLLGPADRPAQRTAGSLLLYSSGTTGRPKGIERPLSGLAPEAELDLLTMAGLGLGYTPDGVFLSLAPLYHSAPNQHTLIALQLGQTVVLSSGFEPGHALNLIREYQVTDMFLVPTMMHRLVTAPAATRAAADTSSVRNILHAGAICPVATKRAMIDWLGPILTEYYGATESGAVTQLDSAQWLAHPGSVGRAHPGMDVKVFDENGQEAPTGVPGLLHLKAPRMFRYRKDPGKTQRSHHDGYFIPGDVGYLDEDGWLFLCDRRTDMIISGGVNVYPAEIEAELLQHDAVADAVVIGMPDPEWGQQVVALAELRPAWHPGPDLAEEIRAHCRRRLARFKVPRTVEFVDRIPRTPTGKVNRGQVREAHLARGGQPAAISQQ